MSNAYKQQQEENRLASKKNLENRCYDLWNKWKKVEAVKLYRAETGCGLRDAMEAVERIVQKGAA